MILFVVLLVASLGLVWYTASMPDTVEEPFPQINYMHQGEFDYTVYVYPNHLYGPPFPEEEDEDADTTELYFTDIIEDITVEYAYGFIPDYPAQQVSCDLEIVAIIYGPSDWEKEVPLRSYNGLDDSTYISFPLELDEFDDLINTIEEELGMREEQSEYEYSYEYDEDGNLVEVRTKVELEPNTYDLEIEARVDLLAYNGLEWVEDEFVQSTELYIGDGTLEWEQEGLNLSERRYQDGFTYKHQGSFGYRIDLLENTLYGSKVPSLSPEIYEWPIITSRPAGETYFSDIIDIIKASFDYSFTYDEPVTDFVADVEVIAVLENPDTWTRTYTLMPETRKTGDFTLSFPLDLGYIIDMADTIGDETGAGSRSYDLSVQAIVHTTADTEYGPIDETFTCLLAGELDSGTLVWGEELATSETGYILGIRTVEDPNVGMYRTLSWLLLVVSLVGGGLVGWNAVRFTQVMSRIEVEARHIRKKYKDMVVDIGELPAMRDGEIVIELTSVDELIKLADTLMKPVLHQASAVKHTYCVIDGLTRYVHTSELIYLDEDEYRQAVRELIAEEISKMGDR